MEMEKLFEQMTFIYKLMGTKEFTDSIATMLWNIYSASIEKGFSKEEAMSIILAFSKSQMGTK